MFGERADAIGRFPERGGEANTLLLAQARHDPRGPQASDLRAVMAAWRALLDLPIELKCEAVVEMEIVLLQRTQVDRVN
jgi:hypothetical protein